MIAEGFITSGAKVYITGRDAKACTTTVNDLSPLGSITAIPADLQKVSECERVIAEITAAEPKGLNVLINNAAANWGEEIDTYPDAAWTKVLTLNLQRVFTLTQLALPLMEKAGSLEDPARIINIGSIDGIRTPQLANYAYSASKAGLHHLSRALARELGPRGITSNTVAYGPFPTKMMKATLEAAGDAIRDEVPARRLGKPEDAAGSCLFLASQAGSYCNGALLRCDGGTSLVSKL